jgi:glycosyltransferase involved in cell wall biosynthesis
MTKASIFSIVIPCYNEERAIPRFLKELDIFIEDFKRVTANTIILEIIFVNNNSTDQSAFLLEKYCEYKKNIQIIRCHTQGYGAALKFGFDYCKADFYGFLDLDNTYPLNTFTQIFALKDLNHFEMIMTNRFSDTSKMPMIRKLGNTFFAALVQLFFQVKIQDACSGLRLIHKSKILEVLQLKENGLSFSIELTCLALKKKMVCRLF